MYTNPNSECFVFNDGNSNALTTAALMNGGGGFGGGYNSPFWALIMLAFLRQWGWDGNGFGNGNGCNCLTNNQLSAIQETLNSNNGNQMLMNAITTQGTANVTATKELASAMNCNYNAVQTAINGIQSAICSLGSKNDMNAMQIVNAINGGNSALANQLSSCCCDIKTETLKMGYENQLANMQQTQLIQNGFCQVGYEAAQNANGIRQAVSDQTIAINNKLDAMESSRKDREIAALTAQVASLTARSERAAELAPIYKTLEEIKGKQPSTAVVQYPQLTAIPTYQLYGAGQFGVNGGIFG